MLTCPSSHINICSMSMLALCPVMKFANGHACIFFHHQLQKAFARMRPKSRRRRKKPGKIVIEHNAEVYRECTGMHREDMWYTRFRKAF